MRHESDEPRVDIADRLAVAGWAYAEEDLDIYGMLRFAAEFGRPIPDRRGIVVQEVQVRAVSEARPNTLSSSYGKGSFPLHTDVAFWTKPARYLVMRVVGDKRRSTTVRSFAELGFLKGELLDIARRSVWLCTASSRAYYCSMVLKSSSGVEGYRFDSGCMKPANAAAHSVVDQITDPQSVADFHEIDWSLGRAVIVDNWRVLHGRGPQPLEEQSRTLYRIYVEN